VPQRYESIQAEETQASERQLEVQLTQVLVGNPIPAVENPMLQLVEGSPMLQLVEGSLMLQLVEENLMLQLVEENLMRLVEENLMRLVEENLMRQEVQKGIQNRSVLMELRGLMEGRPSNLTIPVQK